MDGYQYEQRCAKYLEENGFSNIKVTPGSGDQGIDIIASKDGKKYGIGDLNNSIASIQEEIKRKTDELSSMTEQHASLPLFAFKKKSAISEEINNLHSLIASLKMKAKALQAEVEATNKEHTASVNEAKRKLGQLKRKLKKTDQDISAHIDAMDKKTEEKDLNRVGTELRKAENRILVLKKQIEDLHSNYLLDTYSELVSGH